MDHDINLPPFLSRLVVARVRPRAWLWGVALLALASAPLPAAVIEAWVQRYNAPVTNSLDEASKVVVDANGDIIVTGTSDDHTGDQDFLTIKYSGSNGAVIWQRRHSGPGNGHDIPNGIAVDSSGNINVTGSSYGGISAYDYYTARYAAADGALLWEKRYNGTLNHHDEANALAVDSNGNVVVTGYSYGVNVHENYYTAKYAAGDGTLLWEKRYSFASNSNDRATAVALDAAGNALVAGVSSGKFHAVKYAANDGAMLWENRGTNGTPRAVAVDTNGDVVIAGSVSGNNGDFYVTKLAAANGALLWERRYNGPNGGADEARALALDMDGNAIASGYSPSNNSSSTRDYYTAKYAALDGTLLWEKRYNGTGNSEDEPAAVTVDAGGNAIVTGFSAGRTNGVSTRDDYYTAKYAAADGALLWEVRVNSPTNATEEANALAVDASGDVIVTGTFFDSNGYADYYTAKYAGTNGALLLEMRYNGPDNTGEEAVSVAFDPSGNVLVTGFANAHNLQPRFYTAKYTATNGALLWERRTADTNGAKDSARDLAVDSSGNAIVTGVSFNSINPDFYTAKYAAADGALLWERRYDGPLLGDDQPTAVAIDLNGNAIVTGFSSARTNGTDSTDFYTAKYAAANGALIWEKRYNGTGNGNDAATTLAVDTNGNVIVTGRSPNPTNSDYYTAKYAAANGALVWEKRYNGPANNRDEARSVAVDANGNVIVTGLSTGIGSGLDYYTAKYAAADGTLLWEKRYNGPANKADQANAVAVDSSGNAIVTGFSTESSDFVDIHTIKYAAANGAVLWENRFNGPVNKDDRATAIAIDENDDVVVTGTTTSNFSFNFFSFDFYTAKYASADGALLWEKQYGGPANGDEFAPGSRALAIGPNGTVAIAGASDGSFVGDDTINDFITILYREVAPPGIVIQPQNLSLECTTLGTFSVSAEGEGPFSFQWYFNNVAVNPGGTDSNLTVTASPDTAGDYFVVVSSFAGSITSLVATLTVVDTTPPTLSGLVLDRTVSCNAVPPPVNRTATDACDPSPTVSFNEVRTSGACPESYVLTRTWTAQDANGNVSSNSQIITVLDTTAPVLSGQGPNTTINCPATPVFIAPTATDNCDTNPIIVFADVFLPGTGATIYTLTRTWTAIDHCSNRSASVSQTITVQDVTAPEIICPTNITVEFNDVSGAAVQFSVGTAEGCGTNVAAVCVPVSGSTFPIGTTTVHCAATDSSGNSTTCSFTVTVLGARPAKLKILAELVILRAGVANGPDQKQLDKAIDALVSATEASAWADENHLLSKPGSRVFNLEKTAVQNLKKIVNNLHGPVADELLLDWITRLVNVDRLLAQISVEEAASIGSPPQKVAQARELITKADAAVVAGRPTVAIAHYRTAWKRAIELQTNGGL